MAWKKVALRPGLDDTVPCGRRGWRLSCPLVILFLLCGRNDATDPHPLKERLGNEKVGT